MFFWNFEKFRFDENFQKSFQFGLVFEKFQFYLKFKKISILVKF